MPNIPPLLTQFLITLAFSFLIGLEYHSYQKQAGRTTGFGTTRTFTIIGIVGFVLYQLDNQKLLFSLGVVVLATLLGIYYWRRSATGAFSLLHPLLVLLVYMIGPVAIEQPLWFLVLYVVTVLLILGEKPGIRRLSEAFPAAEAATLAKFLIMAGVILPLLPDKQITSFINVSWYQLWLAVIMVSGISYLSYLAQSYLFKRRGLLLTGILGGLYSSTAASVVIGKQARSASDTSIVSASLIAATTMMYLRLLVLIAALGHYQAALQLLTPFSIIVASSAAVTLVLYRQRKHAAHDRHIQASKHPLELPTALFFAAQFVFFAALTERVIQQFGAQGLHFLAFVVGLTDIDPFILSLLAGTFHTEPSLVMSAIMIASGSNNLLKAIYIAGLARNRSILPAFGWLIVSFLFSLGYVYFLQ